MLSSKVAWSQIIGTRNEQQDHAAVVSWPNGFRLMLLADGMGGHNSGDVASKLVIDSFKQHFISSQESNIRQRLLAALEHANISVYQAINENSDLKGMGTTLIAAVFDGTSIQWLSVGDSPMWLVNSKGISRLNQNHSMSELLAQRVQKGEISEEEALNSPKRSQLLEAVMGQNITFVDVPEESVALAKGDYVILASDGVETCTPEQLEPLFQEQQAQPETLTLAILKAVLDTKRTSQDNASVIVMKCVEEQSECGEKDHLSTKKKPVEEPPTV